MNNQIRFDRWDRALAGVVMLSGLSIAVAAPAEEPQPGSLLSVLQRAVDADAASGMRVGSAIVTPSVEVGGTFDTNVFAASSHEHSDWYASLVPTVDILSDWPHNAFNLRAQGEFRQYASFSREDTSNASVEASGRFDLATNAYILAGGGYQLLHEDRGALVSVNGVSPTQFTVASGKTGFVVEPAPLGVRLDATVDSYAYNNIALFGGTVVGETTRDHIVYALEPRISYQIVAQYNAFVRAVVNRREYTATRAPDGIDRSSTGYETDVGTSFDLPGFAAGEIYVGYINQGYDGRFGATIAAADFGGKLEWRPTSNTSIRFNLTRSVEESALLGTPGYLQTAVRLGIEHELMPRFLLIGALSYIKADFVGSNAGANIYDLQLGARYILSSNLTAGLEYDFGRRASSGALPSFSRQIVELRLRGQL